LKKLFKIRDRLWLGKLKDWILWLKLNGWRLFCLFFCCCNKTRDLTNVLREQQYRGKVSGATKQWLCQILGLIFKFIKVRLKRFVSWQIKEAFHWTILFIILTQGDLLEELSWRFLSNRDLLNKRLALLSF
jgi:hypothetical protein